MVSDFHPARITGWQEMDPKVRWLAVAVLAFVIWWIVRPDTDHATPQAVVERARPEIEQIAEETIRRLAATEATLLIQPVTITEWRVENGSLLVEFEALSTDSGTCRSVPVQIHLTHRVTHLVRFAWSLNLDLDKPPRLMLAVPPGLDQADFTLGMLTNPVCAPVTSASPAPP